MTNEMPKPTEEHRRLGALAGTWAGEERMHPSPFDPKGGTARGTMIARMALGGFHLILDYQQDRGRGLNFEGHGVFGWDPRGKCYTLHWFDSLGVEHGAPAFGTWDGNALVLEHETTHMGHSRQVYEIVDADHYIFRLQTSRDGRDWLTFLDANYRRA